MVLPSALEHRVRGEETPPTDFRDGVPG
jgi:hypothetical protein